MDKGLARKAGLALLGFAATAVPMLFLLRNKHEAPEDLRIHGWPIRLLQVIFARYIRPWIEVEGLGNLPQGSYLVAANHGYRSGVDGFILGHMLITYGHRLPRIVMNSDHRNWMVRMERWVLHHYGIALLVPREGHAGLSGIMANYLQVSSRHAVIIFPAGRAETDPAQQLTRWSTGAVIAARKSGCPVVPVAFSGLPYDWTPETVISAALKAHGPEPPFRIQVRIGHPIAATDDARADLESLRTAIAAMMPLKSSLRRRSKPAPARAERSISDELNRREALNRRAARQALSVITTFRAKPFSRFQQLTRPLKPARRPGMRIISREIHCLERDRGVYRGLKTRSCQTNLDERENKNYETKPNVDFAH